VHLVDLPTTFVSAGAEADPSVADAVSIDAALAPTRAAAAPTGTNTAALLAANAAPAAPIANAAAFSKSLSVGGYTAGTLGVMMHDCVKWVFTTSIEAGTLRVANGVGIGATEASRLSKS